MRLLFIFIDGIGLGENDPEKNPFAKNNMPHLQNLLAGRRMLAETTPIETNRATIIPLDACMGVEGLPQSATGQAVLLTGLNISAKLGHHYGPKPNPEIAEFLKNGTLFSKLIKKGRSVSFLNAYPQTYFEAIQSGRRLYSAVPLAFTYAGIALKGSKDLKAGNAISADFTAQGWRDHLGVLDIPVLSLNQAGQRLVDLARNYDFSFFEYWLSDYAGHGQDMKRASILLKQFDQVLGGLLESWDDDEGMILITSDHGNLEDLSTRRHTENAVPALLIGTAERRRAFTKNLYDLTDITPTILRML